MTRFLIVDDSRTARMTLAAAIRNASHGADVREAEDAQAAMDVFVEDRPEVVFLDMMLDDSAGQGGLGALRAMLDARPEARIVLVTALQPDHADVVKAVSLGAFGHLGKPIRTEAVRKILAVVEAEAGRMVRIR
ncbi:MAG: response regulator [Halobacteriales archaeon]|nr:response regulator [Halobacteriales archaeon]